MSIEHIVIDNIRRIRKEKGISQEKLAEYCDTSTSYIGLMETYKNIPKLSTIERIAHVLNVPVQSLFLTEDEILQPTTTTISPEIKERIKNELMKSISEKIDELLKMI